MPPDEAPPKPKGIPAFMPAKDTSSYWRNKMDSAETDDVVITWNKEKRWFQVEKKISRA